MKKIFHFLALSLSVLFIFSCSDDLNNEQDFFPEEEQHSNQTARLNDDHPEQTVLGELRTNPFTIEVMEDAWQELNDVNIPEPEVTNLYVKFSPSSMEDMAKLSELDEMLYDFPLEYEVIEMGEYYVEADFAAGIFPEYYAIVDSEFSFDLLPFEVVARLYVPEYDAKVVEKAFELTGNDYESYARNYTVTDPYDTTPEDGDENHDGGGGGGGTAPPSSGGNYDSEFMTNDCGCRVYKDSRKPGGCVNVWDTQYQELQGVRQVKVIMKDTWFTEDEVWTSDGDFNGDGRGCFNIHKRYSNKAWMWVKFRNHRANIRGVRGARLWEYAATVKDYIGVSFAPFNQMEVDYLQDNDNGSRERMYWYAATANNALHEYHDYANEDGILPPPNNLDITVFNWQGTAAAPMLDEMWVDDFITSTTAYTVFAITGVIPVAGNLFVMYINMFSPDIAYFYGDDGLRNSDLVKQTFYHEYGHASHFRNVGQSWWRDMIDATIVNDGWGDENGNDAGRISIAESWAEFLGRTYAHRTYPLEELSSRNPTWEEELETTLNWNSNHVPIGLHHDLIDGKGIELTSRNVDNTDPLMVNDVAEGFSISQIFSSLNSSVTNVQQFENVLITDHLSSTNNTIPEVNNLFNQYGQ